jgi:hypothetical protein
MLSAMAREVVERNGIGETADAVWKALNTRHQELFSTTSHSNDDVSSCEVASGLMDHSVWARLSCRRSHRKKLGVDRRATTGIAIEEKASREGSSAAAGFTVRMT